MLDELAKRVSSHVVEVGTALADAGAVILVSFGPRAIVARVREAAAFDVMLSGGVAVIETRCTCVLHELGLVVCRHVWAVLVTADRRDVLASLEIRAAPPVRRRRR